MNFQDYFRFYRGTGSVEVESRSFEQCPFRIFVKPAGHVFLYLYPSWSIEHEPPELFNGVSDHEIVFTGRTDSGLIIETRGCRALGWRRDEYNSFSVELQFAARSMITRDPCASGPSSAAFYLTNMKFNGVDPYIETSDGGSESNLGIDFKVNGLAVSLRPMPNSFSLMTILTRARAPVVTSRLVIPAGAEDDLKKAFAAVNDVCTLLSLACGTSVTWIGYEKHDELGRIVNSHTRIVTIKNYIDARIVDTSHGALLKGFLQETISNLNTAQDRWNIRSAIDLLVDSKNPSDLLVSNGLKVVVCLELLKSSYQRETRRKGETFGKSLEGICSRLKLNIPSEQIRRVVDIRNELVHAASYLSEADENGSPELQYALISHFMRDLLLATVGYRGPRCQFVDSFLS